MNKNKSFTEYYKTDRDVDQIDQLNKVMQDVPPVIVQGNIDSTTLEEEIKQVTPDKITEDTILLTNTINEIKETLVTSNEMLIESITTINKNNENQQIALAAVLEKLADKIEKLEEKLNIEIPTPVVNVHLPKTIKKIHRDNKGHISHITEDVDNSDED